MLDNVATIRMMSLLLALLTLGGCRICADCEDSAYPAYGGAWQRTIRDAGRVGSLFDPGGARAFDLAARDQPEDVVEQERQRYMERDDADEDSPTDPDEGSEPRQFDDRNDQLRDRSLDDIENPKENEQRERKLEEIDVRVIQGQPAPPLL